MSAIGFPIVVRGKQKPGRTGRGVVGRGERGPARQASLRDRLATSRWEEDQAAAECRSGHEAPWPRGQGT